MRRRIRWAHDKVRKVREQLVPFVDSGGGAPRPPKPIPLVTIVQPPAGSTTADSTPTIVGSAPGASLVTVFIKQGGLVVHTLPVAVVQPPSPFAGVWTVDAPTLADGAYEVTATQTVDGVTGTAGPVPFTVGAVIPTEPGPPPVTLSAPANGSASTDTTPLISGTCGSRTGDDPQITIKLFQGGIQQDVMQLQRYTPTQFAIGDWYRALPAGTYQARAEQVNTLTSPPNNVGFSTTNTFAINTVPTGLTIAAPAEGGSVSEPISFSGVASNGAGDGATITVRVYTATGTTPTATQTVQRTGSAWSLNLSTSLADGGWRATASQTNSSGTTTTPYRGFTKFTPVAGAGLAMPKGPDVNGFAQAADFLDSVGVCHHPDYFGNNATQRATGIARLQELGVRHVRLGLVSPANHGNIQVQQEGSQFFAKDLRAANTARNPATTQPVFGLFGTTGEPRYEFDRPNSAVYTIATFLRPLTGPTGSVPNRSGVTPFGPQIKLLENAGSYYDVGWEAAGGLQGPNEPDNNRAFYPTNIRDTIRGLRDAKNAAAGEVVLGGEPYVNSVTGRITPGPAYAPQLPIVAFALVGNNWAAMGDYSDGLDANVGSPHAYWGGHSPVYDEFHALTSNSYWGTQLSYNGYLYNGVRFSRMLPRFITETGYIQKPGSDPGSGSRYCSADIVGEYLIRSLVHNYKAGIRRTFIFSLNDISQGTYGMCATDWTRRASFYAVKNLLTLVGFVQGSAGPPISISHTFTAGPPDSMPSKPNMVDRLHKLVLQRSDTEWLVVLTRDKQLWNRDTQAYMTVTNPLPAVLQLPAGQWTASVAEPAKNAVLTPPEAQAYANPTNGTAYAPLTVSASNTVTVTMRGLTRVVKLVRSTPATDALQNRVVSELNQFATWCSTNAVGGAVTEFGVPGNKYATGTNAYIAADAPAWAGLLEAYYDRLQATTLFSLQWAASEAFRAYELAPYVGAGVGSPLNEKNLNADPLENHAGDGFVRRGIALAGLSFGTSGQSPKFSNANPGTLHQHYYAATQGSWSYLASRGIDFARLDFRWERLQPTLGGGLNATYLGDIQTQVARAKAAGIDVVLDLHNYGEYETSTATLKLGSAQLTSAHFNDVWTRLANAFKDETAVVGYELMNEPHDLPVGGAGWRTLTQSCVNAIRAVDSSTEIYVPGYNWSKVQGWVAQNGSTPWITGHTNIRYVAHHYFDTESSANLGGPAADSGYQQTYASAVADSNAAFNPPLAVAAGQIVDSTGSAKMLRGANMMSQEWDNNMTNERVALPVLSSNWNGNIVTKGFASGPVNSGSATYLAHLDEYVSLTAANQLFMAFVYRTPLQNGDPQPELPDAAATQALTALAARYKTSPHVIFGLQVEPHGASATWTAMRPLFESMVDSIRGASGSNNPNFPLILVPGFNWSRDLSGAIANPVNKPNVVYKTHPYNNQSQFQALFGTAHDAGLPVFVGEFAPNVDMSQADVDALLSFTRARGIGWAAWLFDTRTENLLTSWSGTPSSPYGVSVRNEMLLTP